jgi:hypothetical protein
MDILVVIAAIILIYFLAKISFKILKTLFILAVVAGAVWFLFFQ